MLPGYGARRVNAEREALENEARLAVAEIKRVAEGGARSDNLQFGTLSDEYSTVQSRDALYDRLADQFEERFDSGARRNIKFNPFDRRSPDERAADTVASHRQRIDREVDRVNGMDVPGHVDPQLLRAVMHIEQEYNRDFLFAGGQTIGPMNINFDVWRDVLKEYGIDSEWDLRNDATNIRAGAIILSYLDASIPPEITGVDRVALVASMYGSTQDTMQAGRAIMYGGIVVRTMQEEYPSISLARESAPVAPDPANARAANLVAELGLGAAFAAAGICGDRGAFTAQDARLSNSACLG